MWAALAKMATTLHNTISAERFMHYSCGIGFMYMIPTECKCTRPSCRFVVSVGSPPPSYVGMSIGGGRVPATWARGPAGVPPCRGKGGTLSGSKAPSCLIGEMRSIT